MDHHAAGAARRDAARASKTPFDAIMTGMRMSDVSSSAGDIVGSEMLQSASTQPFALQRTCCCR